METIDMCISLRAFVAQSILSMNTTKFFVLIDPPLRLATTSKLPLSQKTFSQLSLIKSLYEVEIKTIMLKA